MLRGVRLKAYIDEFFDGNVARFARDSKLAVRTCRRIYNGAGASIPVASYIVRFTRGKVGYRNLGPEGVKLAPRP